MEKQKVLIAGGSGLVGSFLSMYLKQHGYDVSILSRSKRSDPNFNFFQWNLKESFIDKEALEVDHIINLTGAGIVDKRWTDPRKKVLIDSRVKSTELIYHSLKKSGKKISNYISASAIGIYGDRADEILTEKAGAGEASFMVDCCNQWEAAAHKLSEVSETMSIVRIGVVLSSLDGALSKFILPLKLGQCNYLGNGKQYFSWIHIEDLAKIFLRNLQSPTNGTFNGVSPHPLSNKDFMLACRKAIAPYALVYPIPRWAMNLAMGEMSVVLFNSNRVVPDKLLKEGFKFSFPDLVEAIKDVRQRAI